MDERNFTYKVVNTISGLNQNNHLKPYAYLNLVEQIIHEHIDNINLDTDTTVKHGLAWAYVSLSIEIKKPIDKIMELYAKTWFSDRKKIYFRRDFEFSDADGSIIFHGAGHSILLDIENRSVFSNKETPFFNISPIGEYTIEAKPKSRIKPKFKVVQQRKVYNSHLDSLKHVNNTRYAEFGYDALSNDEVNSLSNLKRIDLYFKSELQLNDDFSILKATEDNKVIIQGYNTTKSKISFDMIFTF
jgi:acyl-ACP thioesterase